MNEDKRGLTPAGVAVVITACVGLIVLPLLFIAFRSYSARIVGVPIGAPVAVPSATIDFQMRRTFRRIGKDVKVNIMLDNTRSSIQMNSVKLEMKMEGKPPTTPIPSIGPIAAGRTESINLMFSNPPKGMVNFDLSVQYSHNNGNGSSSEAGAERIP